MSEKIFATCPHCDDSNIEVEKSRFESSKENELNLFLGDHICNSVVKMYRVVDFASDNRIDILTKDNTESQKNLEEAVIHILKEEWGTYGFEYKLNRFKSLDISFFGIPSEFSTLFYKIIDTYCNGYFYPAQVAAGALGERILNQLILKTRSHFRNSPQYKNIFKKKSFDNWNQIIPILQEWGIISPEVAWNFYILKELRNNAVHFNNNYNFENDASIAIRTLGRIIYQQFDYEFRDDLFWTGIVGNEIWVKSNVIHLPFVKEFVLPICTYCTPYCEYFDNGTHKKGPPLPLSDKDFLKLRLECRSQEHQFFV